MSVFGIVGHGMIVLYKGKGSPAIKRASGRRGVGILHRQHWRVLVLVLLAIGLLLVLLVLLILIIQKIIAGSRRWFKAIVNGGGRVHGR